VTEQPIRTIFLPSIFALSLLGGAPASADEIGSVAVSANEPQARRAESLPLKEQPVFVPRKGNDRVNVTVGSDSVTYTIASPSGISGGKILPKKGWPKRVVVQLRLGGLESFTVSNGRTELRASVLSHSGHRRLLSVVDGGEEKKLAKDSPYWTAIEALDVKGRPVDGLPDEDGYFQIELPSALFAKQPESLSLSWIDFYR
jgi:hypothetical protein